MRRVMKIIKDLTMLALPTANAEESTAVKSVDVKYFPKSIHINIELH